MYADATVYFYESQRDASIWNFWISIVTEPIKFLIGSIDSLGSNYIIKVFLFFLYVSYKRKYCEVWSGNFYFRRNVIVLVVSCTVTMNCVQQRKQLTERLLIL